MTSSSLALCNNEKLSSSGPLSKTISLHIQYGVEDEGRRDSTMEVHQTSGREMWSYVNGGAVVEELSKLSFKVKAVTRRIKGAGDPLISDSVRLSG